MTGCTQRGSTEGSWPKTPSKTFQPQQTDMKETYQTMSVWWKRPKSS